MGLKEKHGARFVPLMLACMLVGTMMPATALATASKGTDTLLGAQVANQELPALQDSFEQGTKLPDVTLPQVTDPLQQDAAVPAQNTQEQSGQPFAADSLTKNVVIEGPERVAAPKSMSQKVLVDGTVATEEHYDFEWYEEVIVSGELKWQPLSSVRGVAVDGSSFDVDAVSLQVFGKQESYYCQVTEKGTGGQVLNPIITRGDDISEPMKEVEFYEDETCAIITTERETIVVEPGQSKNGLSINTDGTKITMENMNIDGSKNSKGWSPDAVQLIVPPKADGSNLDVVVDVRGTNTLTCKYQSAGGLNWGSGLHAELEGNHEVSFTSSTKDGKIVSNGGSIGCFLGGGGSKSKVAYQVSGGLEIVCTNDQNAPVKGAVGALVLGQADLTIEQAALSITANGSAGLAGFYDAQDAPRIVFGKGSKVLVNMEEQHYESDEKESKMLADMINQRYGSDEFGSATAGIGLVGGAEGSIVLDEAQVDVNFTGTKESAAIGIALAGDCEVKGGSAVSVAFDAKNNASASVYQGIQGATVKIIEQSDISVATNGECGSEGGGVMGLRIMGKVTIEEGEFVQTAIPKLEVLDQSTLSIDVAARGQSSGVYVYSQDDSKGPSTPFGSMVVKDSDVSVNVAAKDQAFGLEVHELDVSESVGHTLSSTVQGATLNCAIMAVKGTSIAREDYTPGYKNTLWKLGENTAILSPAPSEINLFSVEYENMTGFEPGETAYDPADITKPAAYVLIGQRSPIVVDPTSNYVDGITVGSRIAKGITISFAAMGAGMNNVTPLAGDTRFIPVSWKVNPQGAWTAAPYTAAFETKDMATGKHTLAVTFDKETFDGTAWVKAGSTDTKNVVFELYERKIPATGDSATGVVVALSVFGALGILALAASRRKIAAR